MPGSVAHRIHFDGEWTTSARRILERAIDDAEALHRSERGEGRPALQWFCYCKRLGGMTVYIAHRVGWMTVLHVYEATELGEKILLFEDQPPDAAQGRSE